MSGIGCPRPFPVVASVIPAATRTRVLLQPEGLRAETSMHLGCAYDRRGLANICDSQASGVKSFEDVDSPGRSKTQPASYPFYSPRG
jgi:hypothetical protein